MLPPFVRAALPDQLPADVVLADVRWYLDGRSCAEAHAQGHLLGAVFVDLDHLLSGDRDPLLDFQARYNDPAAPSNWRYTQADLNAYLQRLSAHESLSSAA